MLKETGKISTHSLEPIRKLFQIKLNRKIPENVNKINYSRCGSKQLIQSKDLNQGGLQKNYGYSEIYIF